MPTPFGKLCSVLRMHLTGKALIKPQHLLFQQGDRAVRRSIMPAGAQKGGQNPVSSNRSDRFRMELHTMQIMRVVAERHNGPGLGARGHRQAIGQGGFIHNQ